MFRILILAFFPLLVYGQSTISSKWDTIYYSQNKQYYVLNLVGNTQVIYFDSLKYDNNRPITILIKNNSDDSVTISYKSLMSSWVNFKEHSGTFLKPGEYYSISPIFNTQRLFKSSILNAHFAFSYSKRNQSTETIFKLNGHVLLDSLPAFNSNEKSDFPLGQKPTFQAQGTSLEVGSQVTYSPQQHAYYFYWVNEETPTFYWDTINGNEHCVIHIINNSKDTLIVGKVFRTGSSAIYWDYYPSKNLYVPGDTIKIFSKFFKREGGPFNSPLSISYHSSSNLNSQYWHLKSKGFYAPKAEQELDSLEGQGNITSQTDTVTYYKQDQENYYFDLEGKNQKFVFASVIYDNNRPITVFIKNNTSNKINIYPRYHSNTFWKHSSIEYVEPNSYFSAKLIISEHEKFKSISPFIGALRIEYWDSLHPDRKEFYLTLTGNLGLGTLPPFKTGLSHYPNGQIKSRRNPKPENDSLPIYIEYYENGVVKLEEFNRIGIRKESYDQQGRIKNEWDDQGLRTEYYSNGKVKLKETKGPYTNSSTVLTHYFENGCLKKEEFGNQTIIKEYDSLECGKLTNVNTKYLNGKITTHHKEGEIVGQTILPYVGGRIEVKGEYLNGSLVNGIVSYYSQTGILLFENKIANAIRDNILEEFEEQGHQINLLDINGKKTGLWITDEVTKQPITLTNDYYSTTYYDTKSFDFYQYEYINGDTAARVIFHDYGGISHYLYIKEKEERINSNLEFVIAYYTNGYVSFKSYQLKNGTLVGVKYSEEKENLIVSGSKGNCGKMIFKDNKLIEIHSVKQPPEILDEPSTVNLSPVLVSLEDSCVEKGQFKNFELYSGFIYYYKKGGKLIRTEKVVNGIIQGNPIVNFTEPKFHTAALENDLNFNGWPETSEVDNLETINLWLKQEEIEGFKWAELIKFKNLLVVNVNERTYRLDDYANYDSLKLAIQQNKGKQITRKRYSWEGPYDYSWEEKKLVKIKDTTNSFSNSLVKIVDFPDLEASFQGGYDSLKLWLKNNLVYPANLNIEGRVFVSFIVLKDGSITDVKIEKGLHPELDKEAMRLVKSMPNWKPAIWNGLNVACRVRLPIIFKL